MKSFDELYIELRKTAILKLEKKWEKARNEKIIVNIIIFLLSLIVPINMLMSGPPVEKVGIFRFLMCFSIFWLFCTPISALILMVVKIITGRRFENNRKEYKKLFKEKIIIQMLNNFYTDVKYFPNRGLDSFIYSNSRLAERYNIYESDDLIVAKLNNKYTIKLADILAKKRENDSDGGTTTVTVFEGLFMTFKIESSINCNFKIVKNNRLPAKKRLNLDSTKFESCFDVTCDNEIIGMQILTSDIMELLVDFYENTKKKFEISIRNNIIYIRLHTGSMFETKKIIKDVIDEKSLKYYYYMIKTINILALKVIKIIDEKKDEII